MRDLCTFFRDYLLTSQAKQLHGRGYPRFDADYLTGELLDKPHRAGLVVRYYCIVIEHEFDKLALGKERWGTR